MARPFKKKRVGFSPNATYFKPAGVPLSSLQCVSLSLEETEALRLESLEGLPQQECAQKMGIHQSTFARTLQRAKQKIADALVNSKAIKIIGGESMPNKDGSGPEGKGPRTGRGMGNCAGEGAQGSGRGRGRGFGRRRQ